MIIYSVVLNEYVHYFILSTDFFRKQLKCADCIGAYNDGCVIALEQVNQYFKEEFKNNFVKQIAEYINKALENKKMFLKKIMQQNEILEKISLYNIRGVPSVRYLVIWKICD